MNCMLDYGGWSLVEIEMTAVDLPDIGGGG
jgi:hypothetical protein